MMGQIVLLDLILVLKLSVAVDTSEMDQSDMFFVVLRMAVGFFAILVFAYVIGDVEMNRQVIMQPEAASEGNVANEADIELVLGVIQAQMVLQGSSRFVSFVTKLTGISLPFGKIFDFQNGGVVLLVCYDVKVGQVPLQTALKFGF